MLQISMMMVMSMEKTAAQYHLEYPLIQWAQQITQE